MGLGNVRYSQGDLGGAENAFRQAVELKPTHPEFPHPDSAVDPMNLCDC